MSSLISYSTKNSLEAALLKELEEVDFIGELPIDESVFQHLSEVVTRTGVYRVGKKTRIDPSLIPSALFVTTMVFCARYSNEDARNFWEPYARIVWGLEEATQFFQSKCRDHFKKSREYLARRFNFHFPVTSSGDVVRPVYRHALLPYYLQDDFATWLRNNLTNISEVTAESLVPLLRRDESLQSIPPTLRSFIQDEDTAEAAAALIQSMAIAANMYLDGEPLDDITALMTNPIEKSIWHELFSVLVEQSDVQATQRQLHPRIEWVWSLDDHELQLRIANVVLNPEMRPELCVWTTSADHRSAPIVSQKIYPWENEDGSWFIDDIVLAGGRENGYVHLLDEYSNSIFRAPVPEIARERFSIFRLTQQNLFGIRIDPLLHTLNDGIWLLSMAADLELIDGMGSRIEPRQILPVPQILAERNAHSKAGLYSLDLPVRVLDRRSLWIELESKDANIGQPEVVGESPLNASSLVPPAFSNLNIQLKIPRLPERINRLTLWMKSGDGRIIHRRLLQLEREGILRKQDSGCIIDLSTVLPNEPATYLINLRRGIQPVNTTPLQFSVLPDIRIEGPDQDKRYSPQYRPTAYIEGISLPELIVPEKAELLPEEGGVWVEWHDLRESVCRLRLRINQQSIPLAWNIRRIFCWVEGIGPDAILTPDQIDKATLHIRGDRYETITLQLADANPKRTISLNAKGNYDNNLRKDQLSDMVLQHRSTRVAVEVAAHEIVWTLFELVRKPKIREVEAAYSSSEEHLTLTCLAENVWIGRFEFLLRNLNRPLDDPIHLGCSDRLDNTLVFDCDLEPGDYLLEIICDEQTLEIEHDAALIRVKAVTLPKYDSVKNITVAISYLTNPDINELPVKAIPDYLRLLRNSITQKPGTKLNPKQMMLLAALPASIFRELPQEQLAQIWPLLASLAKLHTSDLWQRRHEMLPAWAVVGSPLSFRLKKQGWTLKVYPEVALNKGRMGIGYVDLRLDQANTIRARVSWVARTDGLLKLEVAVPPEEVTSGFDQLDPLDLMPVYVCVQCGQLTAKRDGYPHNDPYLQKRHRHILKNAQFKDLVHDLELVAELTSARGQKLWYTYPPRSVLDRKYAQEYLSYPYPQHSNEGPIITRNGYRRAVDDWVERNSGSDELSTMLDTLVTNHRWQQGVESIVRSLCQAPPIASVPMIAASMRLLQTMPDVSENQPALLALDRTILVLALILRGKANMKQGEFSALNRLSSLEDGDWSMMLEFASEACPSLLEWAFTWVELFHIHAVS